MLSLANPPLPTILDYAVRWYTVNCKACDQPVDVTTIRDEDDPVVAWKTNWYFAFHCPECIVDAAPGDQKPRLAALYRHLRETRHEVGLSGEFESIVRLALGAEEESPMLTARHWQPPPWRRQ